MGWHVGLECPVCGKEVTDEDTYNDDEESELGLYHTKCQRVVRKKK